jgi:hypothetical protein
MNTSAQELIAQVRTCLAASEYAQAEALLRAAPSDQSGWTPQEQDEVRCLEEFVTNLRSPLFTTGGRA